MVKQLNPIAQQMGLGGRCDERVLPHPVIERYTYVSLVTHKKCNHVKPTALRREEKIASIDIAQSPGAGRGPAAATACSLPSASGGKADRGTGLDPGTEGQGVGVVGCWKRAGAPLEAGHSHTERQHTRC